MSLLTSRGSPALRRPATALSRAPACAHENTTEDLLKTLTQVETDLGVPATYPVIEELLLALPPKHPPAAKPMICLTDLAPCPLALLDEARCF